MSPPIAAPLPKDDPRLARDLRLFHLYRLLSTSYLFIPVLVIFYQARGLDFTRITLLNSVYALTAIVFEVPTGALADRFGRRFAMMTGALLMAAGCLVNYGGHGFWTFAVGWGLLALGMTLTSGADSAYLFDLLRSAGREHEYRRREGSATAAKLVGAAGALVLGGYIGAHGPATTYLATAAVCFAAAAVAFAMRERPFEREPDRGFVVGMAHAARAVATHKPLRFAVFFSILVFTLLRMDQYLYPPYLDAAGLGVGRVGLVLAALSLGGGLFAARIDSVRRRVGEATLVWGLPLALAFSFLVLGRFTALWGVGVMAVHAMANGLYSPFSKELLNREISDSGQRATVLSVESMARRLVFGAFTPVAGALIDRNGLQAGLYACAAVGVIGGVLLLVQAVRRHRHGFSSFEGEVTPTPIPAPLEPLLDSAPAVEQIHPSITQ
ncbi:MAG TPA: MFS transporter [Polyangia bacterium]|nr:MFS transporter [Polyangia bacterium]